MPASIARTAFLPATDRSRSEFETTNHARTRCGVRWETALACVIALTLGAASAAPVGQAAAPSSGSSPASAPSALPLVQANGANLEAGGRPFVEFGFTYGFGPRQPVTSYLDDPTPEKLAEIDRQIAQARSLGANTLRIRIQPREILTSPTTFNGTGLGALRDLLQVAEQNRIYLDITGLWARDLDRCPAWYDDADASQRWRAQANFWKAVSSVASSSSAVLEYELATEPIVPLKPVSSWYMSDPSIHYPMPQYLVKDPGVQDPVDLARQWITKMTGAVRLYDSRHLISVGMLPITASKFSFAPANVGDLLDTLTPHIYPRTGKVDAAVETARQFAATGKPVILGETFSLYTDYPTVQDFILRSSQYLDGYLSFYDGRNADEATADGDTLSLAYARGLDGFLSLRPTLCSHYRCQRGSN
jgi:hypothetical protein